MTKMYNGNYSFEKEQYVDRLMTLSQYAWENRIDRTIVDRWLENFDCNDDRIRALEILTKFVYFSENEILRLCEIALQKLLEKIGAINNEKISINIANLKKKYLTKCRFFGVGGPSESGTSLLCPFRQRNSLSTSLFPENLSKLDLDTEFVVFLDDIIATGDTACGFWTKLEHIAFTGKVRFFYLTLLAYARGKAEVENKTGFEVIACQMFDNSYSIFSDTSYVFPEKEERTKAKKFAEKYGNKAYSDWPLGFLNLQCLVGLHDNIPDTTLPIIWAKNGWFPVFERHKKSE